MSQGPGWPTLMGPPSPISSHTHSWGWAGDHGPSQAGRTRYRRPAPVVDGWGPLVSMSKFRPSAARESPVIPSLPPLGPLGASEAGREAFSFISPPVREGPLSRGTERERETGRETYKGAPVSLPSLFLGFFLTPPLSAISSSWRGRRRALELAGPEVADGEVRVARDWREAGEGSARARARTHAHAQTHTV
ncbi:hypothetical protein LX36DRAFT_423517 [Colletotrichum falcatum]|nr:hypothetical protein LX36DRAFT_423517 [Colletotrichum falcatum]